MLFINPIPFSPYEKISDFYLLGDLVCNRDAYIRRIQEQYLYDPLVELSLRRLAVTVLDKLCYEVNDKIWVEKGYLCPRLAHIYEGGGVTYRYGQGALIRPKNGSDYERIWNKIDRLEYNVAVAYPHYIYVSVKNGFNQRIKKIENYKCVL